MAGKRMAAVVVAAFLAGAGAAWGATANLGFTMCTPGQANWNVCNDAYKTEVDSDLAQRALNIMDPRFGAVGDGVTDDTAHIQAAVDAAGAGGAVFIPCGGHAFVVTSAITISNPFVTIFGCALGGVPIATDQGSLIYVNTPAIDVFRASTRAGGCTHDSNCVDTLTFKDFAIALDDGADGTTAINLTNVSNAHIEHMFIRGTNNATTTIGVLSSGILESGALRGGIDNRIRNSFFYSLVRGVVVQTSANANVIEASRFWGGSATYNISVKGICTGGTATCSSGSGATCVACEADAVADGAGECGTVTGTCSSNVTGVVFNTKVWNNDVEDPGSGANLFDRGKSTVVSGNYFEMPTGGGQVAVDEYGLNNVIRDNYFRLSNAGGTDSGVRMNSTFVNRLIVEGNTFHGAGVALNEASATTACFIGRNNYESVTTKVTFNATSGVRWVDTAEGNAATTGSNPVTTGNQPANGSMLYCTDCTIANPCAGSGTGAIAKRLNGVWVCN